MDVFYLDVQGVHEFMKQTSVHETSLSSMFNDVAIDFHVS